jgi:hypothetical protein
MESMYKRREGNKVEPRICIKIEQRNRDPIEKTVKGEKGI